MKPIVAGEKKAAKHKVVCDTFAPLTSNQALRLKLETAMAPYPSLADVNNRVGPTVLLSRFYSLIFFPFQVSLAYTLSQKSRGYTATDDHYLVCCVVFVFVVTFVASSGRLARLATATLTSFGGQ